MQSTGTCRAISAPTAHRCRCFPIILALLVLFLNPFTQRLSLQPGCAFEWCELLPTTCGPWVCVYVCISAPDHTNSSSTGGSVSGPATSGAQLPLSMLVLIEQRHQRCRRLDRLPWQPALTAGQ